MISFVIEGQWLLTPCDKSRILVMREREDDKVGKWGFKKALLTQVGSVGHAELSGASRLGNHTGGAAAQDTVSINNKYWPARPASNG